ncbi:MAG: LicD family protein [Lachnospiraceae bacterium]|nr:LicD family protein [Lachnospiraceae bacterium]
MNEVICLSNEELRRLQMIELELLIEADRICRKCNIHYNIIAGTLLGAVRHGGFIPWDDDADIALLRSEYERFREACKTELNHEKYYFQDHTNTEGYRWGYGKLRKKGTLFLIKDREKMPYEQGVCIDVFPLDKVSDGKIGRNIDNFHCFCVRKVLWSEVGKSAEKNIFKRNIYQLINMIPVKSIFTYYEKMVKRFNNKKSRWVRILMFPTPNKEYGYRREWYTKSAKIEFEGHKFVGIKNYDDYLTFKFGNYMKLPPKSQRKGHPLTTLKL